MSLLVFLLYLTGRTLDIFSNGEVKSNIFSINLEEVTNDVESKNRKMLANRQLEEVTSKLLNTEKSLLDSSQELSKLEMARNGLQTEKEKLTQSIEKLKFDKEIILEMF